MTVIQIIAALRVHGCDPTVDGQKLVLKAAPPDRIAPRLCVVQTGIRAVLTRRPWYFTALPNESRPAAGQLDPAKIIPITVNLLTAECDACWDKVLPAWKTDFPDLFTTPTKQTRAAA